MSNNTKAADVLAEIKAIMESKQASTNESQARIKELEATVEKLTEQAEKKESDNKIEELKSTVNTMQKQLYRVPAGFSAVESSDDMKSFAQYLRTMDHKYLRTDRDPDGGYLVPQEMYNSIVHKIIEVSDFRRLARVVSISGKSLDVNTNESDMTVYAVGEGGAATESAPGFGRIMIPAHKMMAKAVVTNELLADSAYDIVNEINSRAGQKFAQFEGAAFINGDGVGRAQGILQASGVANVNSGHATELTADAFWNMLAAFKHRNPVFIMNRATFAAVRKLKDGIGNYLLDSGLNGNPNMALGGVAGQIAGVPVVLMQDMPDIAASAKPIVLGDFQEAYMIVERLGMSVVRDDLTLLDNDQVKFVMSRRVGGAVVNPEALLTMTISA